MEKRDSFKIVGQSLPRVDGFEKVTGQATYGTDVKLPGMLYAKILRSPHPHARLLNVDTSKAEKLTGVRAVITGKSIPMELYGAVIKDTYFMALEKVRYVGEPVAAVAAIDEGTAGEALSLIQADYEPLPAAFG